jgi:hypothetical protein
MRMVICLQIHTVFCIGGWKNYFCQLLNVHGVNDVRQTEIHTAEPLVHKPSCFKAANDTEKIKVLNRQELAKFRQN